MADCKEASKSSTTRVWWFSRTRSWLLSWPSFGNEQSGMVGKTETDDLSMVHHDFGLKTRKEIAKLKKIEWNSREKLKTIPPSPGEPEDLVLVRQKVLVSHVRQGQLPNCWVMCGLAAVVYCCPELIKEIVREVTVNGVDMIEVLLYKNGGQRVVVRITDLLPCSDGGEVTGRILFGQATERQTFEFWMPFDKFLRFFDRIDFCTINSEWLKPKSKCLHRFAGQLSTSAEDHRRFGTYLLKVGQDNTMVHVTLHQEFKRRAVNFGKPYQLIAIGLFEFEENADNPFNPKSPLTLTKFSGFKHET